MLEGGDRRSIGRANEVVSLVQADFKMLGPLLECLWDENVLVRMRAADALEKVSRTAPAELQGFRTTLLNLLAETTQQELRWSLALIIPRLRLTRGECVAVAECLEKYLEDRSSIVKTFAMQGLADLIRQNSALRSRVTDIVRTLTRTGTPAMRARGRNLLPKLERHQAD